MAHGWTCWCPVFGLSGSPVISIPSTTTTTIWSGAKDSVESSHFILRISSSGVSPYDASTLRATYATGQPAACASYLQDFKTSLAVAVVGWAARVEFSGHLLDRCDCQVVPAEAEPTSLRVPLSEDQSDDRSSPLLQYYVCTTIIIACHRS